MAHCGRLNPPTSNRALLFFFLALVSVLPATVLPSWAAAAPARADLVIRSLSASPSQAAPGATVSTVIGVENTGSRSAGTHNITLWLTQQPALSSLLSTSGAITLKTITLQGLASGARSDVVASLYLPSNVAPGNYYIQAMIDSTRRVRELSESNNVVAMPIRVAGTTASPAPPPLPPSSRVLWSAGFETGDKSEWYKPGIGESGDGGGEFNSGTTVSQVVTNPIHSGHYALKATITTPSTAGVRLFRWDEPRAHAALYYSAWYYVPQVYMPDPNNNWWIIWQWKVSPGIYYSSDPYYIIELLKRSDGTMYLQLGNWYTKVRSAPLVTKNIPIDQWFHIEVFYDCQVSNTGRVTVWQDGVLLWDLQNVPTRNANSTCEWSIANYSDQVSPSPTTIYVDDVAISLDRIGP
jgi:CARDB/Polysaccharide lyase